MRKLRNSLLRCDACGYEAPELEWDEVWSFRVGGFIAFCCPQCKMAGKTFYVIGPGFSKENGVVLSGLDKIKHFMEERS